MIPSPQLKEHAPNLTKHALLTLRVLDAKRQETEVMG